uniref:RanBD1 domain-containing protein n=1 Tax=Panagrolaimus sp. PS1159 TaxID=55785 RepID=A0AC35GMT8_9BILA
MKIADKAGTKGCGIFSCIDFSENPTNGTSTVFYVRFREERVYEEFKKLFNEIAEGNPTTAEPAVAATPSPVKTEAQKIGLTPAETKSLFGNKPFSFAPPSQPAVDTSPFVTQAKESLSDSKPTSVESKPKSLFGGTDSSNANKTPLSFSSFASGTSFLAKNTEDTPNDLFGARTSSTFANQSVTEENENPEEYVPDAQYEPVIPLPDKVDIVTGEESEEVLFKNRCKLYIFNSDTKEVKERGVGDIKVLFNLENKTHRVVMRREQVHKICANFRITKSMKIADKAGTKGCGAFNCVDFSDNSQEGTPTVFFIRFRDEKIYEQFKKLLTEIAEGNLENSTTAEPTSCITKRKPTNVTVTSSTTVYDPYFDVDEAEEGEDEYENCDEEIEILLESDCKVTLGEPYKSPFSKKLNDEVYEHVKLVVKVADEDIYELLFVNGESEQIFPHFIHSGSSYAIDGKKISFVASDLSDTRKAVVCEFKNAADALEVYQTLQECSECSRFAQH